MFVEKLYKEILFSLSNLYSDNYDHYRYGPLNFRMKLGFLLSRFFKALNFYYMTGGGYSLRSRLNRVSSNFDGLNFLYQSLSNTHSKDLLVKVVAFRVLGNFRYKISANNPEYFEAVRSVRELQNSHEFLEAIAGGRIQKLFKHDLNSLGFDINIFLAPNGIVSGFIWRQYEYSFGDVLVRANPGDFVIDAGGCYGETALYFSKLIGNDGRVYSVEFIPGNLKVFNANLNLNPELKERVTIVNKPVWSKEGLPVFFQDKGPGSKISFEQIEDSAVTMTCTIDGIVRDRCLPRVDFIKMDIEGAEIQALNGAMNTIKEFKPKLAISVYHRMSDFGDIAMKILQLNPAYKLYLNHYTIHAEETILFAVNV